MRTWSTPEVRQLTHTSRADFDYWRYELRAVEPDVPGGRWSIAGALMLSTANVLRANGFSHLRLKEHYFLNIRRTLDSVSAARRASLMLLKHVEIVEALVKINGAGPDYATWRAHVDAILQHAQRTPDARVDRHILQLLSQRHAATAAGAQTPLETPHA